MRGGDNCKKERKKRKKRKEKKKEKGTDRQTNTELNKRAGEHFKHKKAKSNTNMRKVTIYGDILASNIDNQFVSLLSTHFCLQNSTKI